MIIAGPWVCWQAHRGLCACYRWRVFLPVHVLPCMQWPVYVAELLCLHACAYMFADEQVQTTLVVPSVTASAVI
jgi:hypothetical protein